jgi:hypothetical protein
MVIKAVRRGVATDYTALSKKWAGPAYLTAHVPLPILKWLHQTPDPLIPIPPSLYLPRSLPFHLGPDACSASLRPSPDVLLCSSLRPSTSPPSLVSALRSTATAVPFQIEQLASGKWKKSSQQKQNRAGQQNRRGEGGTEGASACV